MNLQEKRQQLWSLIPTSKELTKGCILGRYFYYNGENHLAPDFKEVKGVRGDIIYIGLINQTQTPPKRVNRDDFLEEKFKVIIGHPPQLNDLLRALETNGCDSNEKRIEGWEMQFITSVGKFKYKLTESPLSQDEETTDKLIELLS